LSSSVSSLNNVRNNRISSIWRNINKVPREYSYLRNSAV